MIHHFKRRNESMSNFLSNLREHYSQYHFSPFFYKLSFKLLYNFVFCLNIYIYYTSILLKLKGLFSETLEVYKYLPSHATVFILSYGLDIFF